MIDIAESLLGHGITKLLVVSTHDGNPAPVENAARELNPARHGSRAHAWLAGDGAIAAGRLREIDEDHGGQSEMSVVLYLAPALAGRMRQWTSRTSGWTTRFASSARSSVVPHGYSGTPSQGTAAEGEAILEAIAAHVGPFLPARCQQLAKRGMDERDSSTNNSVRMC